MPQQIELSADRSIQNMYATDGRKLKTTVKEGEELMDGTKYYKANFVFDKQKEMDYILFDEGRIVNYGGNLEYEYHLKDHLSSVRVAFEPSANGTAVVQENAYYPFGAPIAEFSYNATDNKNRYLREGKEYIDDFDWNKYDFLARTFDSWELHTPQIDPLCEKYYHISPYAMWMNNPIKFIDPDGEDIWEMNRKGEIRWIGESEEHTLYALGEDGSRNGQSITVRDRAILDGLASTGSNSGYTASFVHGNPSELASVFLFASDNSSAEWLFSRYDEGSGDQYAIGTVHDIGNGVTRRAISPKEMGFSEESEIASIHSHPTKFATEKGENGEHGSMGWRIMSNTECDFRNRPRGTASITGDSANVLNNTGSSYENYYTYFPASGNIYQVRGSREPALIKNIKNHNNNSKKLFWGTLNGK